MAAGLAVGPDMMDSAKWGLQQSQQGSLTPLSPPRVQIWSRAVVPSDLEVPGTSSFVC